MFNHADRPEKIKNFNSFHITRKALKKTVVGLGYKMWLVLCNYGTGFNHGSRYAVMLTQNRLLLMHSLVAHTVATHASGLKAQLWFYVDATHGGLWTRYVLAEPPCLHLKGLTSAPKYSNLALRRRSIKGCDLSAH